MLDCIQTESTNTGHLKIPLTPFVKFILYFLIIHIQISTHKIIEIDKFIIGFTVPVFTLKKIKRLSFICFIPIRATKMSGIPFEVGVFSISSWEIKFRPRLNNIFVTTCLLTVFVIAWKCMYFLCGICSHFVI